MTQSAAAEQLPLKPIDADTVEKLAETVAERDAIRAVVDGVVEKGLRAVYWVGAGGSLICSHPAHYLLVQHGTVPSFQVQSDELNCSQPALMDEHALVVLASYTGKTKETVAAARTAAATGATVIAAAKADSPLAEAAHHSFLGKSDLFEQIVAFAVLEATGAELDWEAVSAGLTALPEATRHAVEEADPLLAEIAADFAQDDFTFILGSGPSFAWAYGMAMCFLQEMQWKQAAGYNSGEFFQGAFEMVDEKSAVLVWLGEDPSRPMGERALAFLRTYAPRHRFVDVAELELPGIPAAVRGEASPIVIAALANRLSQHYEHLRQHDLETRRYMFKVDY
ncbi:MAG: SIS domain-containing protein [Nocardioidaceae bacterium]